MTNKVTKLTRHEPLWLALQRFEKLRRETLEALDEISEDFLDASSEKFRRNFSHLLKLRRVEDTMKDRFLQTQAPQRKPEAWAQFLAASEWLDKMIRIFEIAEKKDPNDLPEFNRLVQECGGEGEEEPTP